MAYTLATYETILQRDARAATQYLGKLRAALAREGKPLPSWARALAAPQATPARPLVPLVVPPELTAWRSRSSTRVFTISIDGRVCLADWQTGPVEARFAAVADALAAIAADAIRWRATPRKSLERQPPSAGTESC